MKSSLHYVLPPVAMLGLAGGLLADWTGFSELPTLIWSVATLPVLISLLFQIATSLRRGDLGLDVVAALSMSAGLLFGEALAANVVALMYLGGQLLEAFAQGRARREMTALLGRVSHTAMRLSDGSLQETAIDLIEPGDRLFIRKGEVLPVDGRVAENSATLDLSALTGEPVPKRLLQGEEALSGSTCAGSAFHLVATRTAQESTYAGVVRLVEAAQQSRPPMVRLADQFAIWFLALTIIIAAAAWMLTNEPVRALAVLVVATPCPLILAVPVALISGMSRAAGGGVLIKDGAAFEALGRVDVAILDKTGTLTHGRAAVSNIQTEGDYPASEVLRLAASLDQASNHVVAASLIEEALARSLQLSIPTSVHETAGAGIRGVVDGHEVLIGGSSWVSKQMPSKSGYNQAPDSPASSMTVRVVVDGRAVGQIILDDVVREDAPSVLAEFRQAGVSRIILASGDRSSIAQAVGQRLGVDASVGNLDPKGKVEIVNAERQSGCLMMVGDGVNDAPALAAADVGVAMGARGAAASSEAAGVVVLVDELMPLAQAIRTAKRSRTIALQSVYAGLGLSLAGMAVAAFGYLPPVQGALVQEAIDVAVIANALRALR